MGTRSCYQCAYRDHEEHMLQVQAKNKGNGQLKWKWSCYPCQGRKHPVEQLQIEADERKEAEALAEKKENEQIYNRVAKAWTSIYQREVKVAQEEMSDTLLAPFEKFDFADVSQTNELAHKQFVKLVEDTTFAVREVIANFSKTKFNGDEAFLAENIEFLDESKREFYEEYEEVEENYPKPGAAFVGLLALTLPIAISYGLWEILPWWQSLGVGLLALIVGTVFHSEKFMDKYPSDFKDAFNRLYKNILEFDEDVIRLHQTVLENSLAELIYTGNNDDNAKFFMGKPYDQGFIDKLESAHKFPYDFKKAEREALVSQLKVVSLKDNFLDIASYVFLYKVAQSDGVVSAEEEEQIASLLDLGGEDYAFANSLRSYPKVDMALIKIIKAASIDAASIESLIEKLFAVAQADGNISESEVIIIDDIGLNLGVTQQRLLSLRSEAESSFDGSAAGKRFKLKAAIDEINFDDL